MAHFDWTSTFANWERTLGSLWNDIKDSNSLIKAIKGGLDDKRLYGLYLIQTFHYTFHNSRNQALVVKNIRGSKPSEIQYMKYCLKHAQEEAGHELMALHDLNGLGLGHFEPESLPEALPEAKALTHYLYAISETGNPYQRLGYSFWAEGSYKFFGDVLASCQRQMGLKPAQMTFFIEHSDIDADHYDQIKEIIAQVVKSPEDLRDIERVMKDSLYGTAQVLEGVYRDYSRRLAQNPNFTL